MFTGSQKISVENCNNSWKIVLSFGVNNAMTQVRFFFAADLVFTLPTLEPVFDIQITWFWPSPNHCGFQWHYIIFEGVVHTTVWIQL